VYGGFCPRVEVVEREVDHSFLPIIEVKNEWSYTSHSFVVCLAQPVPQRVTNKVRSTAFSFNFLYLFLIAIQQVVPRLSIISILPCNFPSITCFRRQFYTPSCPHLCLHSADREKLYFYPFVADMWLESLPFCSCHVVGKFTLL
jgi:hypothetical protein